MFLGCHFGVQAFHIVGSVAYYYCVLPSTAVSIWFYYSNDNHIIFLDYAFSSGLVVIYSYIFRTQSVSMLLIILNNRIFSRLCQQMEICFHIFKYCEFVKNK